MEISISNYFSGSYLKRTVQYKDTTIYIWTFLSQFIVNYRDSQSVNVYCFVNPVWPCPVGEKTKLKSFGGRIKEILTNQQDRPMATGDIKILTSLEDNLVSCIFNSTENSKAILEDIVFDTTQNLFFSLNLHFPEFSREFTASLCKHILIGLLSTMCVQFWKYKYILNG